MVVAGLVDEPQDANGLLFVPEHANLKMNKLFVVSKVILSINKCVLFNMDFTSIAQLVEQGIIVVDTVKHRIGYVIVELRWDCF